MHLRQPGFTYSACKTYTKNRERIQKSKEKGDSRYIYQNELNVACFQNDIAYRDFNYFPIRTASDKVQHGKVLNIAKNPKYDGYHHGLT